MPAASTVNGTLANGGAAAGQTFQTGDIINANATSSVNVNIVSDAANSVAINTAGTVTFRNLVGAALVAGNTNAILWNNVGTFASNQSLGAVDLVNGALATTYANTNSVSGQADGLRIGLRAGDLAGTADTIKFSVSSSGSEVAGAAGPVTTSSVLTSTSTGVESISIATSGSNWFTITGSTAVATDSKNLIVTGTGSNTIDARALTQASNFNLSGSSARNTLRLDNILTSSSTITGGSGADTLRVAPTAGNSIANLSVSAIETLRLGAGSTGGTLQFLTAPNFTNVRVDGDSVESNSNYALNTVGSFSTLEFRGDGVAANAGATQQFQGLTVSNSFAGTSDVVALNFANGGTTLTGVAGYLVQGVGAANGVVANGVETFNVNIADSNNTSAVAFSLNSNTLSSASISGAGIITSTINALNAAGTGSAFTNLNLSGITSPANGAASQAVITLANGSIGNTTVTGSSSGVSLSIGAEAVGDSLTFNGTAGFDTVNATPSNFAGSIIANMGGGTNVLNTGNAASSVAVTANTANATNTINVTTAGSVSLVATGATSANTVQATAATTPVAGIAQVSTVTPTGLDAITETLSVTIGGVTYAQIYAVSLDATLDTFVTNYAVAILAATGVTVTANAAAATALTFTGPATGAAFTAPTAVITGGTGSVAVTTVAGTPAVAGTSLTLTGAGSTEAITFTGSANADTITGGAGNDTITGGAGADRMAGGTGADLFIQAAGSTAAATAGTAFTAAATTIAEGETFVVAADSITDFSTAQLDTLRIQGVAGATTVVLATTAITNAGANDQFLLRGTFAAGTFTAAAAGVDVLAFLAAGVAAGNGTAIATLGTSSTVLLGAGANIANIGAQVIV